MKPVTRLAFWLCVVALTVLVVAAICYVLVEGEPINKDSPGLRHISN